jgi:hypothetical protein
MISTSNNDKSLLIQTKPTKVIYSDKSVSTLEPANECKKEGADSKDCSSEDIKVSLVVMCCPCPIPAKCEDGCESNDGCCECKKDGSPCECTKDGSYCECAKDGCCCANKIDAQPDISYTSVIYSLFSCCAKKSVVENDAAE